MSYTFGGCVLTSSHPAPSSPASFYTGLMYLVAVLSSDPALARALSNYRDLTLPFHLHPIPPTTDVARVAASLEALDFAGALFLDDALQTQAFEAASKSSLDAQETAAADSLTVTPGGLIAEYNVGRAVGGALREAGWIVRGASVVVLGTGARARAVSRELSSGGAGRLAVLAASRPVAERTTQQLPATTETIAKAQADPLAVGIIERADLLVRVDPNMQVPSDLLGPHLSVVDLAPEAMSPLRKRAVGAGAMTLGLRDVQAHGLALSLGHMLGARLEASAFSEVLHSL